MSLKYHKAITDDGGAIGDQIYSGDVGNLLPEVLLSQQTDGAQIPRKFYIANDGTADESITLSISDMTPFTAIMFASSGDSETIADLTGSETDETPISVTVPAGGHVSFWLRLDIPAGSTETDSFGNVTDKMEF